MRPPPLDDAREWRTGSRRVGGPLAAPRRGFPADDASGAPRVPRRAGRGRTGASPATCLEHAGPRAAATHGRVVADMSRAAGRTGILEGPRLLQSWWLQARAARSRCALKTCHPATNYEQDRRLKKTAKILTGFPVVPCENLR